MDGSGYRRYERFFHAPCQEIVEWRDDETAARGWLVINSLRGGAAGGGTRMRQGATLGEATFLAKTMEIKFGVSGPPIGGAKSVLSFAPKDVEEKRAVLRRWFQHIEPWLKRCYGTGGDQGVNEAEVIQLTQEAIGLKHPQEGIVHGHYGLDLAAERRVLEQLNGGVELPVRLRGLSEQVSLADVITGFGVATSLATFYAMTGDSLHGKRVLVEGFGAVGGSTAYYLHEMGARVVGVISYLPGSRKFRWHAEPVGLDVPGLFAHREGTSGTDLPAAGGVENADPAGFWNEKADIFIPAATSYTIDSPRIEILRRLGVHVIACGANTPFADRDLGSCAVQREADRAFSIIPDFIANCGMARTFAYLMDDGAEVTEAAIEADVAATIRNALEPILDGYGGGGGLLDRAFSLHVPATAGA
jgi:glutamate dehydrogenase/leucine dehydrogenase